MHQKLVAPRKLKKEEKETKKLLPHDTIVTHICPHQYLSIIICTYYYSSTQTQITSISHNELKPAL